MVHNANKPPKHYKDVLLILGPYPYTERLVGYYDALNRCWCQRCTEETWDGSRIVESMDCYVAGWMDFPDIELWKDQLLGEYEWEREHYDTD